MSCGKALMATGMYNLTLIDYPGYDHGFCPNMPDGLAGLEASGIGAVICGVGFG